MFSTLIYRCSFCLCAKPSIRGERHYYFGAKIADTHTRYDTGSKLSQINNSRSSYPRATLVPHSSKTLRQFKKRIVAKMIFAFVIRPAYSALTQIWLPASPFCTSICRKQGDDAATNCMRLCYRHQLPWLPIYARASKSETSMTVRRATSVCLQQLKKTNDEEESPGGRFQVYLRYNLFVQEKLLRVIFLLVFFSLLLIAHFSSASHHIRTALNHHI